MNAEFATWLTQPVPPNWTRYRNQWEYAHAFNALHSNDWVQFTFTVRSP